MATQKQVDYVMSLQEQLELEDCEKYTDEQVKAMSHKEVSNVIENYKTSIRNEEHACRLDCLIVKRSDDHDR